jgi:arylsulfatase A-like enzyme
MADGRSNDKTLVERAPGSTFPRVTGAQSPGYVTGQFGKSPLGDCHEHLPSVHGFDETFGHLVQVNAEEEPENRDHPKDPRFSLRFGRRCVLPKWATDADDLAVDRLSDRVGTLENTPLTIQRIETIEFTTAAMDWIDNQGKANKPFFCH